MTLIEIESQCRAKADELLEKHFGNLSEDAAINHPETIEGYSLDLPKQIEAEYYDYLRDLWNKTASQNAQAFETIIDKKHLSDLMTDDDREGVNAAYDRAARRTLWERLTKTNYKDVIVYKSLLKRYAEELLLALRCDFMEDVRKTDIKQNVTNSFYIPDPVDTSNVQLSDDLLELAELMAENVHDVWAKTRMEQGWTYGTERDDAEKKHPCLVPYDQLPEEEKAYDRNTSIESLKFIVKAGFQIKREKNNPRCEDAK